MLRPRFDERKRREAIKTLKAKFQAQKEQKIRDRAYFFWQEAGCPEGDGIDFWLRAEQEHALADPMNKFRRKPVT